MAAEPAYMCRLLAQWNWRSSGSRSDRNKRADGSGRRTRRQSATLAVGGVQLKSFPRGVSLAEVKAKCLLITTRLTA